LITKGLVIKIGSRIRTTAGTVASKGQFC